jgi:lipopolysaccharide biosynthesis regulator YciM
MTGWIIARMVDEKTKKNEHRNLPRNLIGKEMLQRAEREKDIKTHIRIEKEVAN